MTQNLCHQHIDGCAGDVRYYDWDDQPGNVRRPVLWTARSGATISGHVWEVQGAGSAPKPGVVITNGSVQAPEELYWNAAAELAKAGYVVLTWDPQTQGRSDRSGEAPTQDENALPQSIGAFTDGTVDALDFFTSTPSAPFAPRNSRTNGAVNHAAKQNARVAAGKNAPYNPLHASLDPGRIGLAGNSLGARAVSEIASTDTRVDAVVAWDALSGSFTPRVPGLGLSGDYGIGGGCSTGVTPTPCTEPLDPQAANGASHTFSGAGVPTGQINTRAGTHFESALIPNGIFPATLRGMDQLAWYTVAWLDRWVKGDESAEARLLTSRWHRDRRDFEVDPAGRGNLFSANLRSRYDFPKVGGGQIHCEDLRQGCGLLVNDTPPLPVGQHLDAQARPVPGEHEPASLRVVPARDAEGRPLAQPAHEGPPRALAPCPDSRCGPAARAAALGGHLAPGGGRPSADLAALQPPHPSRRLPPQGAGLLRRPFADGLPAGSGGPLDQHRVVVRVRRRAAAEQHQRLLGVVPELVLGARRDRHAVARADLEGLVAELHPPAARGEQVELLGPAVVVRRGRAARRHGGLGQALLVGVLVLADLRAVQRGERLELLAVDPPHQPRSRGAMVSPASLSCSQ